MCTNNRLVTKTNPAKGSGSAVAAVAVAFAMLLTASGMVLSRIRIARVSTGVTLSEDELLDDDDTERFGGGPIIQL